VELKPITAGTAFGEMVEILSGVKAGEPVVLNPPDRLKNGSKIRIKEE
jgi:HlyD family secretion protein